MRVLIEGRNLEHYLAKCHEALRTGLRGMLAARCYGPGYPGYRPRFMVRSYRRIAERVFPGEGIDVLVFDPSLHLKPIRAGYRGLRDVAATTAFVLGDYWDFIGPRNRELLAFVEENRVGRILSYFPQPLRLWREPLGDRLRYLPPSFDPRLFNDWGEAKAWDVGFLAAGTAQPALDVYPERWDIHNRLLRQPDLRYLWAEHPGWGLRRRPHPLVGRNFSRAINSCRIFITTGGIHRNAHAKIIEALASRALLMCDEVEGAAQLGLIDGQTYVRITPADVVDKVRHFLARPDECERIATAGHELAFRRHTCYARALDFAAAMRPSDRA